MARTDPRPHYGQRRPRLGANGYITVWKPDHPLAMADGYVLQHRQVAWDARIITDRAEHVHHLNGDRTDNRPENLAATTPAEHAREHAPVGGTVRNQHGEWPILAPDQRLERERARNRENQRRIRERRRAASA